MQLQQGWMMSKRPTEMTKGELIDRVAELEEMLFEHTKHDSEPLDESCSRCGSPFTDRNGPHLECDCGLKR